MSHRVLVVEDEAALAQGIRFNLVHEGFEVEVAASAEEAEARLGAEAGGFDLVLLDVMLPGRDGFALLEDLRACGVAVPVILLTARSSDVDVIRGLELGADDYVVKPFSLGQLVARIRAVLRRLRAAAPADGAGEAGAREGPQRLRCGPIELDLREGWAFRPDGARIELTPTEAEILRVLADAPGGVASRSAILDRIWGADRFPSTRTVDNHIARLRKKLEPDPAQPVVVVTVHGEGYRLRRT